MGDTVLTYLDSYCERAGNAAMMAEPINLITNIFFVAAALVAMYKIIRLPPAPIKSRADLCLLAAALFAIGIGSGLWHLQPNGKTVLMDVIPITLFINLYLISAMRRLLQLSWGGVVFWWAVYMGASLAGQKLLPPDLFNGTVMYLPTYVTLVILMAAVVTRSQYLGKAFVTIVLVWTASLIFRTYDMQWCETFPSGTHFLWHTLNAFVLYKLLLVLIHHRPPEPIPGL